MYRTALFATAQPQPRQDQSTSPGPEAETRKINRPNIFRPAEATFEMQGVDYDDPFKQSSSGLNVGLAAFYSLPKLGKDEADQILQELRSDMDH